MPNPSIRLFLSCVSDEFGAYRDALRHALTRPNVEVKIQEDFKALGGDTLKMLAEYVEHCEAVIHFVGDMVGSTPAASSVDVLLKRHPALETRLAEKGLGRDAAKTLTYTQWEAWLAIGFDKDLLIVEPAEGTARGPNYEPSDASRAAQAKHLKRLRAINRYPGPAFKNEDNLVAQIFGTAIIDALVKAAAKPKRQPRNLPLASLGDLFKGRDEKLEELRAALADAKGASVLVRALHGLGGVGKTRLAIEYAWAREADYSALLFVRAESPEALNTNFAALGGASVLDLPEKEAREDAIKIEGALSWLGANPTWLMILDNVDDPEAVKAVVEFMPRLKGGHVIVTARAANFPASVRKLELDTLDEESGTQFLLERTADDRLRGKDDEAQARTLARELGGLALGLEQAGAQIATDDIGFARYLKLWNENREKVLGWSDPTLTGSERTLATTWATSVAQLSPESHRLLDRLALLAPDPIPDSLLDVSVPGEAVNYDAHRARAGLFAYSLIARAKSKDGLSRGIVVHRLVQDFARRAMSKERGADALSGSLNWVHVTFAGNPEDVRAWPVLDLLVPHALAIARRAHEAGIAEPTALMFHQLGVLFYAKARYAEAEPLMRRVVEINEQHPGREAGKVATSIGNLALLLLETNRAAEAEPLLRRALALDKSAFGETHPRVAIRLSNLAELLRETNRPAEAESLIRRALQIDEAAFGPDDPNVAIRLNNLAGLLQHTNREAEAERLYRRALALLEREHGPDHPRVAAALSNLASLLQRTHPADAECLYRRALAIDEASYEPNHPNVAIRLGNLATVLSVTKRFIEAEPLSRRALEIDERAYGSDNPKVAFRLSNLASLLSARGRIDEAEPLVRRALVICEKNLGRDHPVTVTLRSNLAAVEAQRDGGA
jgi:tetratricopeptide (TPR) repeat protein